MLTLVSCHQCINFSVHSCVCGGVQERNKLLSSSLFKTFSSQEDLRTAATPTSVSPQLAKIRVEWLPFKASGSLWLHLSLSPQKSCLTRRKRCAPAPRHALSVAEQSGMCKGRSTTSPRQTLVTCTQTIPTTKYIINHSLSAPLSSSASILWKQGVNKTIFFSLKAETDRMRKKYFLPEPKWDLKIKSQSSLNYASTFLEIILSAGRGELGAWGHFRAR